MLNKSHIKKLSLIIISMNLLASCSKKALTELASTEGQNQQDNSNSGGQDGNLNSNINTINGGVLSDTGIESRIPIATFGELLFASIKIQIRNLSVPMFAGM